MFELICSSFFFGSSPDGLQSLQGIYFDLFSLYMCMLMPLLYSYSVLFCFLIQCVLFVNTELTLPLWPNVDLSNRK